MKNIIKLFRYGNIYGFKRAIIKSVGRGRWQINLIPLLNIRKLFIRKKNKTLAIIGCGQFAYSTIAFFIIKRFGPIFKYCADINLRQARSFAKAFRVPYVHQIENLDLEFIENVKLVYISSNHASHTPYACFFLERGIHVFIEKPISVSKEQLESLICAYQHSKSKIYFGYNRPFSQAVTELKNYMGKGPFSLSCTIIGHFIPSNHWYRNPEEGTRVCGNLGHWLDLAIHLLRYRGSINSKVNIAIVYSNQEINDDDISVSITTEKNDLINIILTSREEPFEGINETIIFQQQGVFVKIDDFRRAEFHIGHRKIKKVYKPKDVGHQKAIMQPFTNNYERDVDEVFSSTDLMLHVTEMVRNRKTNDIYQLKSFL